MTKLCNVVVAVILGPVFTSCFGDGGVELSGLVSDHLGNPIGGAYVYIETRRPATRASGPRVVAIDSSRSDGKS
jgi:hypothetical protein